MISRIFRRNPKGLEGIELTERDLAKLEELRFNADEIRSMSENEYRHLQYVESKHLPEPSLGEQLRIEREERRARASQKKLNGIRERAKSGILYGIPHKLSRYSSSQRVGLIFGAAAVGSLFTLLTKYFSRTR